MNPVTVTDKHTIEAMKQLAPALANKAIEIALAEQATQDQYITADEARALGVGNAEIRNGHLDDWLVCYEGFKYHPDFKYRAIRKEVPAEPRAELKAMYAQQVKDGTRGDFVWESMYSLGQDWMEIPNLSPLWNPLAKYRCTPKPTCQVRNDDTGELKTMTRGAAKKLQAETKDTCGWFLYGREFTGDPEFDTEGIYTYKQKSNLVKLDSILMTREAAIAIWESKKDTHTMWFKMANSDLWFDVKGFPKDMEKYFSNADNVNFELRPKAKKSVSLDPAIREGVIALLQELGLK